MVDVALEQAGAHVHEELVPEGDDEVDNDELKSDAIDEWKTASVKCILNPFVPNNMVMLVNATGHRLLVRGTLRSRRFFLQHIKTAFDAKDVSAELELQWQEVCKAAERAGEVVLEVVLEVDGDARASIVDVPKDEHGYDIVFSAYTSDNKEHKVCGKLPVNRHRKVTFNGLGLAMGLL